MVHGSFPVAQSVFTCAWAGQAVEGVREAVYWYPFLAPNCQYQPAAASVLSVELVGALADPKFCKSQHLFSPVMVEYAKL